MTKTEALKIFGGRGVDLAKGLGLTKARISQWPEVLEPYMVDQVLVAAIRAGKLPLEALLTSAPSAQAPSSCMAGSGAIVNPPAFHY